MNIEYIPLRWHQKSFQLEFNAMHFSLDKIILPTPHKWKVSTKEKPPFYNFPKRPFIISLKAFYNSCKISIIKSWIHLKNLLIAQNPWGDQRKKRKSGEGLERMSIGNLSISSRPINARGTKSMRLSVLRSPSWFNTRKSLKRFISGG